jgi:PTS system mannose-specific IIA component
MIGIVVAAHGNLAQALVATAQLVVGSPCQVVAVGIKQEDDTASYEARLQAAVAAVREPAGAVLVLTDMFGGTPANVGLTMHQPGRVEVLTGANLPMLIKALQLCHTQVDLAMVAGQVRHSGARAITVASEVLCGSPTPIREKSA